jgi:hypothetical protein
MPPLPIGIISTKDLALENLMGKYSSDIISEKELPLEFGRDS